MGTRATKEREVVTLIRSAIAAGRLPHGGVYTIFGGRGDGHACACCQQLITAEDAQYDVCVVGHGVETLPMHLHCYQTWEVESRSMSKIPA